MTQLRANAEKKSTEWKNVRIAPPGFPKGPPAGTLRTLNLVATGCQLTGRPAAGRLAAGPASRRPAQISDFHCFAIFAVFLKFWGRSSKSVRKKCQILKANVSPAKLGFFSDFLTRGSKAAIPCPCPAIGPAGSPGRLVSVLGASCERPLLVL